VGILVRHALRSLLLRCNCIGLIRSLEPLACASNAQALFGQSGRELLLCSLLSVVPHGAGGQLGLVAA
jgi:hypothetical protein